MRRRSRPPSLAPTDPAPTADRALDDARTSARRRARRSLPLAPRRNPPPRARCRDDNAPRHPTGGGPEYRPLRLGARAPRRWPRPRPLPIECVSPRSRRAAAAAAPVGAAGRPPLPPSSGPVRSSGRVLPTGEPGQPKGTDVKIGCLPCSLRSCPLPPAFHRRRGAPRRLSVHAPVGALAQRPCFAQRRRTRHKRSRPLNARDRHATAPPAAKTCYRPMRRHRSSQQLIIAPSPCSLLASSVTPRCCHGVVPTSYSRSQHDLRELTEPLPNNALDKSTQFWR